MASCPVGWVYNWGMETVDELRKLKPSAVDWSKYMPSRDLQQAPLEEQHLYSEEAEAILIDIAERLRRVLVAKGKRWKEDNDYFRAVEEEHQDRVDKIRLMFFQKRTGMPF
jgi:hypothetical protein